MTLIEFASVGWHTAVLVRGAGKLRNRSVKAAQLFAILCPPEYFFCDGCLAFYRRGWSDEEAQKECLARFGCRGDAPDMAVICETCWSAS